MLKVNVQVVDNKVEAKLELGTASLAELTICERLLRRYLQKVVATCDGILDKDTQDEKPKPKLQIQQTEEEGI